MASKLFSCVSILFLLEFCLTAPNTESDSSESESNENRLNSATLSINENSVTLPKELTDEDIKKWKQELSKDLTTEQLNQLDGILSKFGKGTSNKQHVEGMVELLIFAVAVRSNATESELRNLFNEPLTTPNSLAQ